MSRARDPFPVLASSLEGTHRLLGAMRRTSLDAEAARKVATVLRETGEGLPTSALRASLSGDPAKLRGIPVVGVPGGFGGAIRGTRPTDSLSGGV